MAAAAVAATYLPGLTTRLDSDASLVQRCLSGDDAAWEELIRAHTRRVYGLCFRFTGKDAEAQDLTQEVFLRVFRTVKSYRMEEGSFATSLTYPAMQQHLAA